MFLILLARIDIIRCYDSNTDLARDVGDELLPQIGHRLSGVPGAVVGRLGGDEFAIVFPLSHPCASDEAVSHVHLLLAPRFVLSGAAIDIFFSIRVVTGVGKDFRGLPLPNPPAALRESKSPNRYELHKQDGDTSRLRLADDLRHALANREFLLHYQPKVDLVSGKIVGAEALLRWHHPIFGMQPPGRFIPMAEETGLIVDIGEWVLCRAAEFAVQVNRGRPDPLIFSANVSQVQFRYRDMAQVLGTVSRETGADPSWLMLELTESLFINGSPEITATLHALRDIGVGLSIDDFGTGYSNLHYLYTLPIGEIKIDKSFVSGIHSNRSKHVIVDAVIRLGRALGVAVTAEGMETEDEVSVLRELGCPYGQGFFFGRPLPNTEFEMLLARAETSAVRHPHRQLTG